MTTERVDIIVVSAAGQPKKSRPFEVSGVSVDARRAEAKARLERAGVKVRSVSSGPHGLVVYVEASK